MLGKILGIIFLILIGIFALCSCKVASLADQEMKEDSVPQNKPFRYENCVRNVLIVE